MQSLSGRHSVAASRRIKINNRNIELAEPKGRPGRRDAPTDFLTQPMRGWEKEVFETDSGGPPLQSFYLALYRRDCCASGD